MSRRSTYRVWWSKAFDVKLLRFCQFKKANTRVAIVAVTLIMIVMAVEIAIVAIVTIIGLLAMERHDEAV